MAFLPALPDPAASPLPGLLAARGGIAATEGGGAAAEFAALLAGLRSEVGKTGAAPGAILSGGTPGVTAAAEAPRTVRSVLLETAAGLSGEAVQAADPADPATPTDTPAIAAADAMETSTEAGDVPVEPPAESPVEPPMAPVDSVSGSPEPERRAVNTAASPPDAPRPPDPVRAETEASPERTPTATPSPPSPPPTVVAGPEAPEPADTGLPEDADTDAGEAAAPVLADSRSVERDPAELAGEVAIVATSAGTPAAPPPVAPPADNDAGTDTPDAPERTETSLTLVSASEAEDVAPRTVPRAEVASATPGAAAERPVATARGPDLPPQAAEAAREAIAAAAPASESAGRPLPAPADGGETIQPATAATTTPSRADTALATPPVSRGEAPPAQASNAGEVSLVLARAAADGQRQITIRMHPAELGKVEIRLDFGADGALKAAIRADTPEALDLLQRDVRLLERALNDAGFRQGQTSLDFSLGQEARQQAQGQGSAGSGRPDGQDAAGETELDAAALADISGRRTAAGGIDIVI